MWQGCADGFSGSGCDQGVVATMEWAEAVARCEELDWGGYQDWRLPDRYALESIVDNGESDPGIDESAFPNTPAAWFLSSSSYAGDSSRAWLVNFDYDDLYFYDKTYTPCYVRCVRSGQESTTAVRFARIKSASSSDYYVSDEATGLMWQGCSAPLTGESCSGTAENYTWQEALDYCENLGFSGYGDWRLPNRRELLSIADDKDVSLVIDETAFPNTAGFYFWTSSSYAGNASLALSFHFAYGYPYNAEKTNLYHVRCVRGGL